MHKQIFIIDILHKWILSLILDFYIYMFRRQESEDMRFLSLFVKENWDFWYLLRYYKYYLAMRYIAKNFIFNWCY